MRDSSFQRDNSENELLCPCSIRKVSCAMGEAAILSKQASGSTR
jgi:hypothetical protein